MKSDEFRAYLGAYPYADEQIAACEAGVESLEAFGQSQSQQGEYVVHRKDTAAHVVEDPKLGLYAYALFEDYSSGTAGALHSVAVEKAQHCA